MTRKCSHCSHNGHNSRTCPHRGFKLFGVRLTDAPPAIRKSVSLGNLLQYSYSHHQTSTPEQSESGAATDGYVSDGLVQSSSTSSARERKKGVPWTEDEHRMFLLGLQKLGKGDWRGISRNFVPTRTPTQVASHAQKYFLRQSNLNKRKRRSSLFDIPAEVACSMDFPESISKSSDLASPPNGELSLGPSPAPPQLSDLVSLPLAANFSLSGAHLLADTPPPSLGANPISDTTTNLGHSLPFPLPLWPGLGCQDLASVSSPSNCHRIKRAPALHKIDESAEISDLTLSIAPPSVEQASPVSVKLDQSSRQLAFPTNNTSTSISSSSISSNGSLNSAISVV